MADGYRLVQLTKKGGWIQTGKVRQKREDVERELRHFEDLNRHFKMGIEYKIQKADFADWEDV